MESNNALKAKMLALAIAIGAGGPAITARADELQDLKAQVEALQKKVGELETKQETAEKKQAAAVPDNVVTGGATKGSFKLPGSNTSVTLGGYVKLDAVYSNPSAGVGTTADLFLQPNAIAVGPGAGDNERNQVKFGARESRMFAKTSTPTSWGDLVTYIEGDFYGADGNESVSNSHGLRLRHAYGSLGHFLGGQTWTNFMYVPSLPETLDFGGPVGQIFDRQAQVRWTQSFDGAGSLAGGQWSVSLENPESVVTVPGGANFRADDDRFPDVTGQVVFNTSRGKIAVSGILRQIRADSKTPAVVGQTLGGAISVAGVIPAIGKDDVRFALSAGNAIGRYSDGFFPDGVVGADGQIRLPKQWGWYVAYRHFWTDSLRSNLVLSGASETNPAGAPASTDKSTESAHANLIWRPVANTDLGLEYIYANRKTEDGLKGHLNRLQASAKYTF
jgi:outer membrane DcaP-like protein